MACVSVLSRFMSCSRYIGLSECQTTKIDRKVSDIKCDKKKAGVVIDINVPSSDHRGFTRF